MGTWRRRTRAIGAAAILLWSRHPADAGLFSWLGGNNQNDGSQGPIARGLFGGHGGEPFQPAPQVPRSGAFHGDELPPEEGTEATRQWMPNPARGTPTL